MTRLFVAIYTFFLAHKRVYTALLLGLFVLMGWGASRLRFEENIMRFLPDGVASADVQNLFSRYRTKDRLFILVSAADADALPDAADTLAEALSRQIPAHLLADSVHAGVRTADFLAWSLGVTDRTLPALLTDADYRDLDALASSDSLRATLRRNLSELYSPWGSALKPFILNNPLGLSRRAMRSFLALSPEGYTLSADHLFLDSAPEPTVVFFLLPALPSDDTGGNDALISTIERTLSDFNAAHPALRARYFGAPAVAVHNARQIKRDTYLTFAVALLVVVVFILLTFPRRRDVVLILFPVAFGSLFSLCLIGLFQGTICAIAVGSGCAVLGIALSYSIHFLAHQSHVQSVPQLIRELTLPLTIGSFTTIGAFYGLTFTTSPLLRDFGWFSSLALVGTTLCCLVFLPPLLQGLSERTPRPLYRSMERLTAYAYERNRPLIFLLAAFAVLGLMLTPRITFTADLNALNYEPDHLIEAERILSPITTDSTAPHSPVTTIRTIPLVSYAATPDAARRAYRALQDTLAPLRAEGLIYSVSSASDLVLPDDTLAARLARWQAFWTPERIARCRTLTAETAAELGIRPDVFAAFFATLERTYTVAACRAALDEAVQSSEALSSYAFRADSLYAYTTLLRVPAAQSDALHDALDDTPDLLMLDKGYFARRGIDDVSRNFNLILWISSLLVFGVLLLSYGRVELALMAFTPMCVGWLVILAFMVLLHIPFNIVTVIISTFIFGIGDDFAIFIMDGLTERWSRARDMLTAHKTAIFCSSFTTMVGIGALFFARHPALSSLGLMSVVGMSVVVLTSFTVLPVLHDVFIARPTAQGCPPWTLTDVLRLAFIAPIRLILWPLRLISPARHEALVSRFPWRRTLSPYASLVRNYIYRSPVLENYMRVKIRMEHTYAAFDALLPREGLILDLGCGYAPLTFALALSRPACRFFALDHDANKVDVARHTYLAHRFSGRISFVADDAASHALPTGCSAVVLSDMLHYLSPERQNLLLEKSLEALRPDGVLLIRDGNSSDTRHQRLTALTEFFSTRLLHFNRTSGSLHFLSSADIHAFALSHGLSVREVRNDAYTSNTFYLLTR